MKNQKCFIVCWFGKLPECFKIWMHTCRYNNEFDYLIFTDQETNFERPDNVYFYHMTLIEFKQRAETTLNARCSIDKPYRVCDFRPMYGAIFSNELKNYKYWGYCDIDLVFGKVSDFITNEVLNTYDAVFNGGPFTLIRNTDRMNELYLKDGAAFNYKTVITHDAIFAFDETTGIQRIAQKNSINACYMIPYIETEIKNYQLRSRLDISNPDYQAYYWENGELFRTKLEDNNKLYYQKYPYLHLQKRKINVDTELKGDIKSFWISPDGFHLKEYLGVPHIEDVDKYNPFQGKEILERESYIYRKNKIRQILKRSPYQIFVRVIQGMHGINKYQHIFEGKPWVMY